MNKTEQFKINSFFADIMFDCNWFEKVDLNGDKVVATSDSVFADTWNVFNKHSAEGVIEKLQKELSSVDFSQYLSDVKNLNPSEGRSRLVVILKEIMSIVD